MKRRITLSIALVLSVVLVALTNSDSTVKAQNQIRIVANTGVITLGPNQKLRLSVVFDDTEGSEKVAFRRLIYASGVCAGGICKHAVSSQTTTAPVTMLPGEAALFDMIDPQGQILVLSNGRKARVNALIIDTATGETVDAVVIKEVLISS
jgi:hypothetical protein